MSRAEEEEDEEKLSQDASPKSETRKKIQALPDPKVSPMRTVTLHTAPEDHFDREEDSIQAEKATVKRMPSAGGAPPQSGDEEVPKWQRDLGVDLENDDEEGEDEGLPDVIRMNVLGSKAKEEERASRDSSQSDSDSGPKKKIVPIMDDLLRDDDEMNDTISLESGDVDLIAVSTVTLEADRTPDDLATPEAARPFGGGGLEWEGHSPDSPVEPIPEYSARQELEDNRNWRTVDIGQCSYRIDMKVIEPYKKVLSHGGYYGDGFNALVIFAACHLPDRSRKDYQYVMDNLFLYVISTLELLVVEDYMIVYFHGSTPKQKMPGLRWLKRCYDMIDRRLRKNLKGLLIVHPTLWLKTVVMMTRPFISSKFSSKLHYVKTLRDLSNIVPTEYIFIPDEIKEYDTLHCKSSNPVTPP
ncbi:hypothetical protein CAPTEDRAFT_167398 [Capitella teleta]|uniref:CRAL-TRIO domain-containing protein n=1 Tax=Capitella teleta TaxID=283909 RepID=R7UWV2_CAPTE|nr:hypothetical protein CAPTEDRAFT_167398 [Capitella teleta]|eukprot:ELU10737.1 hypothetical protein CAPTEDRAFT_167398 [Capitella teleta]